MPHSCSVVDGYTTVLTEKLFLSDLLRLLASKASTRLLTLLLGLPWVFLNGWLA